MNIGTAGTAQSQRPTSVELIAAMLWDFRLELALLAAAAGAYVALFLRAPVAAGGRRDRRRGHRVAVLGRVGTPSGKVVTLTTGPNGSLSTATAPVSIDTSTVCYAYAQQVEQGMASVDPQVATDTAEQSAVTQTADQTCVGEAKSLGLPQTITADQEKQLLGHLMPPLGNS